MCSGSPGEPRGHHSERVGPDERADSDRPLVISCPITTGEHRNQVGTIVTFGPNEELKRLLLGCARRDAHAFSTLYRATSPKLFGVALRILRREDWAEEVLQDCYLSIWNNASSYAAELSAPLTWMTSIVRNRCLDWLRRPRLELAVDAYAEGDESFFDTVASEEPGPLEQVLQANDAAALRRCLAELDPKHREVIALAFFDGLSHTELAERLQHPLGTVKTWVRRGLERLKGCLG